MIPTILAPSASTGMTVLALLVIAGPVVAWALASRRRAAGTLAAIAAAVVLLLTLSPTRRSVSFGCAIDWSPQLTAAEPLANVLLLVPFVLLLAVASGRPVRAAIAGSALSFGVELVQAVVPALGRSCDTSDWIANTTGAVIGAVLAGIGMAVARHHRRSSRPETGPVDRARVEVR